jgi:hypothetical protein
LALNVHPHKRLSPAIRTAWASARAKHLLESPAKGTYRRDKFYRLKARRRYKRAAVAIAHKILLAIYNMFSPQVSYNDLGDLYRDKLNQHPLTRNLVHRLERLGYTVTLTLDPKAA